jgi:hypothetical protein
VKFLLVVIVLGVAIYLLVRVIQRRGLSTTHRPGPDPGPRAARRPVSPDDDPDFLRGLQRKRPRRQDDPDNRPDGG